MQAGSQSGSTSIDTRETAAERRDLQRADVARIVRDLRGFAAAELEAPDL